MPKNRFSKIVIEANIAVSKHQTNYLEDMDGEE